MNTVDAGVRPANPAQTDWELAVAEYLRRRAVSDALIGHGQQFEDGSWEVDRRVDAYCEAMDALIEDTPAPNMKALLYKMELASERAEGFCDGCLPDHWKGIRADIARFAVEG